jgi:hypothetical protein
VTSFPAWLVDATVTTATPAVTATDERWEVVDAITGGVVSGLSAAEAHQRADLTGAARIAIPTADRLADLVF